MKTDIDYNVIDNMATFGGSFVKSLAECMRRADDVNFIKLKNAFTDYYQEYLPEKWNLG